ncbi:hypothetical protein [Rhodothermus marinus]|uniref:hypothetical protein n=1 Tax=Rhodothermus marinus TaxID=29549 RepID=UPI000AF350BE|nr:hypothetical protein [Rhodothermus marinus]
MPVRALGHIARRLLILAAGVLAVGLVLFVALTRTRAGRDFVRAQLEAAFQANLGGQFRIERLDGDLIHGLYATRVRLYTPDGRLLLEVDSVALRPSWRMLLSHTLAFRRVELFHPRLFLRYENGRWNFAQWRDTSAAPSETRWGLVIADLHLHDGTIETDRTGPPPEPVRRGQLFDFTQTRLDSLTLQATLEYHPDRLLLDLLRLDAHLSHPDQRLRHLSGQLFYQEGRWHLPRLELALGNTLVALSGQFIPRTPFAESALQLELETGTLDFAELRRLLPGLPLHQPSQLPGGCMARSMDWCWSSWSWPLLPDACTWKARCWGCPTRWISICLRPAPACKRPDWPDSGRRFRFQPPCRLPPR